MSFNLTAARYGKDKVRVFRVVKNGNWHEVVEYNVCTLLEGDIETSFTKADNTVVVATDSIKNITYYLAKTSPHILHPERFALHLGSHIVGKYAHIHKATVSIEQLRWHRIAINGQDHTHSFYRDGDDKRTTEVEVDATAGKDNMVAKVTSGIADLLVIKTTGSAFENFVRDEYTTLAEVTDRIFSTSVDLRYSFIPKTLDPNNLGNFDYDKVASAARAITLEIFATDESASVQATLYKMAERLLAEHGDVEHVAYTLPNKHYLAVDMKYIGIDNLTPSAAEVFCPVAAPSGLISATVSRK
ncbi:uricase [Rickenella mellea]|uniref:Uricase n=1 Tax=Rickenella mellea TaxID=50990 RepID=A0A4Y7QEP5_9AGAM|nr:uricase [Rickenella mellea]